MRHPLSPESCAASGVEHGGVTSSSLQQQSTEFSRCPSPLAGFDLVAEDTTSAGASLQSGQFIQRSDTAGPKPGSTAGLWWWTKASNLGLRFLRLIWSACRARRLVHLDALYPEAVFKFPPTALRNDCLILSRAQISSYSLCGRLPDPLSASQALIVFFV